MKRTSVRRSNVLEAHNSCIVVKSEETHMKSYRREACMNDNPYSESTTEITFVTRSLVKTIQNAPADYFSGIWSLNFVFWMMQRQPYCTRTPTTHQLLVDRRQSEEANVWG